MHNSNRNNKINYRELAHFDYKIYSYLQQTTLEHTTVLQTGI